METAALLVATDLDSSAVNRPRCYPTPGIGHVCPRGNRLRIEQSVRQWLPDRQRILLRAGKPGIPCVRSRAELRARALCLCEKKCQRHAIKSSLDA